MTARDDLLREMTHNHLYMTDERAEELVAAYAHELAEQIRAHDYDPGEVGPVHLAFQEAAELIDPFRS
ncbi:hypothetical protein ACIQV3_22650 [Streptomyces sp. NPDC099050]|uniref:hypothetical protein n=1 Tax=Streptomyces sp. NPDC099050 TaxID=3366100 RepID=UPI0037F8B81E